jgi:hypothetical protein
MRKGINLILIIVIAVVGYAGLTGHIPSNPCTTTAAATGKC